MAVVYFAPTTCLSIGLAERTKGVITERNKLIHDKFACEHSAFSWVRENCGWSKPQHLELNLSPPANEVPNPLKKGGVGISWTQVVEECSANQSEEQGV